MTGFSRREGGLGAWTWAVEARSVNGRNLEARFRGPPGFEGLERVVREGAQARFQRGQIAVNLQAKRVESAGEIRVNHNLIELYLAATAAHVQEGRATPPSADGLLALRGVIESGETGDDPEARQTLETAMAADIQLALDGLAASRVAEGRALYELLVGFLSGIEALIAGAEAAAEAQGKIAGAQTEAERGRHVVARAWGHGNPRTPPFAGDGIRRQHLWKRVRPVEVVADKAEDVLPVAALAG